MKETVAPILIGALSSYQRIGRRTRKLGNKRTSGDHPNYYIIENDQNTEKSPGHLRIFVVTQTPVKGSQC